MRDRICVHFPLYTESTVKEPFDINCFCMDNRRKTGQERKKMKFETNDVSHLEWMSEEADKENKYEKPWENGSLRVTKNGRYFCCGDTPFFWMGDTAWLLFHQLTSREAYWL